MNVGSSGYLQPDFCPKRKKSVDLGEHLKNISNVS